MKTGIVYLVGAGPGAPDLITLRGAEALRKAQTVVYDRLVHPDLLRLAPARARLIYAGKEGGGPQTTQEEINEILVAQARLGRTVVRLKGGDPFVFGRGGEEALALAEARIPFEIVPGISSGVGVPALAGIPVTHRGLSRSVTFVTAHTKDGDQQWARYAPGDTLVIFMGGQRLKQTAAELIRAGRASSTPAAVIESGSWDNERVIEGTLGDIAERVAAADLGSPALFVVGEVISLRQKLSESLQRAEPSQRSRKGAVQ
ncbi:MAG: uroporphyrinogen-III C-methyltransferase [Myxococcaceae bacterium]